MCQSMQPGYDCSMLGHCHCMGALRVLEDRLSLKRPHGSWPDVDGQPMAMPDVHLACALDFGSFVCLVRPNAFE